MYIRNSIIYRIYKGRIYCRQFNNFIFDTDNGQGLQFGKEYTYRIVAVYPNGTESKASNEITSALLFQVFLLLEM